MRALVMLLCLLAGLKIWTQDHLYRTATADALIKAYRARAIDACEKGGAATATTVLPSSPLTAGTWTEPAAVKLVIGRPDVDVHIWDIDNPLWETRFKHPHLVLSGGGSDLVCAYDVVAGLATVSRL
jgi:hypothetical protein